MITALKNYWFSYCYWDFNLTRRDGSFNHEEYKDGSIKSLYDTCGKYSNCPDLCDSIKNVRYSGEKLIGFGIAACVFGGISFIMSIFKFRFKSSRVLNWIIYLSTFSSALIYTIGVIIYKSDSKFDGNFYSVKKSKG